MVQPGTVAIECFRENTVRTFVNYDARLRRCAILLALPTVKSMTELKFTVLVKCILVFVVYGSKLSPNCGERATSFGKPNISKLWLM